MIPSKCSTVKFETPMDLTWGLSFYYFDGVFVREGDLLLTLVMQSSPSMYQQASSSCQGRHSPPWWGVQAWDFQERKQQASGQLKKNHFQHFSKSVHPVWLLTIQIKIFNVQLLQRLVKLLLNQVRLVARVPQFRRDEEIFAIDDRGDDFLQTSANLFLIPVHKS